MFKTTDFKNDLFISHISNLDYWSHTEKRKKKIKNSSEAMDIVAWVRSELEGEQTCYKAYHFDPDFFVLEQDADEWTLDFAFNITADDNRYCSSQYCFGFGSEDVWENRAKEYARNNLCYFQVELLWGNILPQEETNKEYIKCNCPDDYTSCPVCLTEFYGDEDDEAEERRKWVNDYNNSLPQEKWYDDEIDIEISIGIGGIYDSEYMNFVGDNIQSNRIKELRKEEEDKVVKLITDTCGHPICEGCFGSIVESNTPLCPICRQDIDVDGDWDDYEEHTKEVIMTHKEEERSDRILPLIDFEGFWKDCKIIDSYSSMLGYENEIQTETNGEMYVRCN